MILNRNDALFGPYIVLPKGEYQVCLKTNIIGDGMKFIVQNTSDSGKVQEIEAGKIDEKQYTLNFELNKDMKAIEFVLSNTLQQEIEVQSIKLTRIS